jgi:signal peptidase II
MSEEEAIESRPASLAERSALFLVTAAVIVADHLSQLFVEAWLPLNQSYAPFPEVFPAFRITHVSNTGAAFGLFPEGSLVFAIVAAIVSAVIVVYNYRLPAGHRLLRLALGLQLAGALGNLIDRVRLGHVTDFFDVGPWPVFNIADASIVAGVAILAYLMLLGQRQERQRARQATAGPPDDYVKQPAETLEDRSIP